MDATQLDQVLVNLAINARNAMSGWRHADASRTDWRLVLAGDGHEAGRAFRPAATPTIDVSRYRHRHSARCPAPHLRSVLHHPPRRGRHRPRPVHGPGHRCGNPAATLSVRSVLGEGTRFCITLPRYEGAAAHGAGTARIRCWSRRHWREVALDTEPKLIGLARAERAEAANVGDAARTGEVGPSPCRCHEKMRLDDLPAPAAAVPAATPAVPPGEVGQRPAGR